MDWVQNIIDWFKDQFQIALDFFLEIFSKLWELICKVGTYIFDFFFDEQKGLVWQFFDFIISLMKGAVSWLPDLNGVMQKYQNSAGTFQTTVGMMNQFFPISEALALAVIFLAVVLACFCWRWIVKLVRGA